MNIHIPSQQIWGVALWGFEGAEKEEGQSCALIPVCSADWDTAVDG